MDLNGDGLTDILSGSYSRMDGDMAGLFQVLWGEKDGKYGAAKALAYADGEPLILPGSGDDSITDRICTRPTAADLNGDGHLDLVVGNFSGTFYLYEGKGKGQFAEQATQIQCGAEPLEVSAHSDPFLVDWDVDGDLDIVTGTAQGGVYLIKNTGNAKEANFAEPVEMVKPVGYGSYGEARMGDAFMQGPQAGTRVWVDDLNGDKKLDLLVGDNVTLLYPAEGLDEATATKRYEAWTKRQADLMSSSPFNSGEQPTEEALDAWNAAYAALNQDLTKIVDQQRTGFVWALYQK